MSLEVGLDVDELYEVALEAFLVLIHLKVLVLHELVDHGLSLDLHVQRLILLLQVSILSFPPLHIDFDGCQKGIHCSLELTEDGT